MKTRSTLSLAALVIVAVFAATQVSPAADQPKKKAARGQNLEGSPKFKFAVPETVRVERDIVYAKYGSREVQLDLYLPKKPDAEKIPCIVCIHGGGWRSGDKNRFAAIAAHLADKGFAVACIGYRLLPEVEFPAPVVDCKAAVRWVRANAAKYGIDPDRIGAIGGSAGGHLVAMLGTSAKVAKLEGEGGNPGVSSRVQAVVAMATPADMTRFGERSGKVDKDLITLISPVTHVDQDAAPILLLHGTGDKTVPMEQSEMLLAKYRKAGVAAELVKIKDAPHAFWNGGEWFAETMDRSVKFFRATLGVTAKARE